MKGDYDIEPLIKKIAHLTLITFEYIINAECDFMNKYNLKEIEEKLNRCRNMKFEDVTLDDVDELMRFSENGPTADECLTRVLENLYK